MKRLAHLMGFWLWIGFSGGAIVLLFVATPIESLMKERGTGQVGIDLALSGIALAWIIVSFLAARFAAARVVSTNRRMAAHAVGVAACAVVFMGFLQAGSGAFGFARAEEVEEGRFTYGPYPDEAALVRLDKDGYTGVISLLNSLIPFEAVLLEKERHAVAAAGLEMIEAPMLPWVSANRESLDKLALLASSGRERYYVHCYLGRHRVELARMTLMDAQGVVAEASISNLPEGFELGPIRRIGDSIIVGPLPTAEEFFTLRSVGVRHIVSLLDPRTESARLEVDRAAARDLMMELHALPANDSEEVRAAVLAIRLLEGRVYVHGYRDEDRVTNVLEELE